MTKKPTANELRAEAQAKRNAAASQSSDVRSGNYPQKLGRAYFEKHIAKLEREADELDADADRLDRGE